MRLVGREREAAAVEAAVADALSGMGGVAAISGEPGIGKTTLARAVGSTAAARGGPGVVGRGIESAPVYWPWLQVLRARVDAVGEAVVRGELGRDGAALLRVAPDLQARLAVEPAPGTGDRLRLFDAFERWLLAAATHDGLLVVLEDLHWVDRDSVRLLEHVAEGLAASRALVLRDVPIHGAGWRRGGRPGRAADRQASDAGRVVGRGGARGAGPHRCAGGRHGGQRARAWPTGGNPLFVTELGRLLVEDTSAGEPIDDAWPREVPETVRALIRRRLGRLAPRTRAVLQAAAVVGWEVPVAMVAAMVRAPAIECMTELDAAQAAGVVEAGGMPGRQRFVHALVRDAVVGDLPIAERVRLHRAAADALEAAVDREVQPSAVAGHLAAAEWAVSADEGGHGERLRAARWASRAADEATRRLAWDEAVRLRRHALDLGGSALDDVGRCELLLGLARALAWSGELAAGLAACRQAADLARAADRSDLLADAALVLQGVGDPASSHDLQRLVEDALQALDEGAANARARLLAQLAEARLYQHDERGADVYSQEALAHADIAHNRDTLLVALHARRLAILSPDGLDETVGLADRVLDLATDMTPTG